MPVLVRLRHYFGLLAVVALTANFGAGRAPAQGPGTNFSAGETPLSGEALQRKLSEPVGVSWSGVRLRDAVDSLARNTRISILLDRRVDTERPVDWSSRDVPLRETIAQLAASQGLAATWVGSVAYLGPPEATAGLTTLLSRRQAETAALSPTQRALWAARKPLKWDALAEPRALFIALAAEAGCRVTNETLIPHDLWGAWESPPLTIVERLSLVTAGFGLTYRVDPTGTQLTLEPWPADLPLPRPMPTAAPSSTAKPAAAPPVAQGTQVYTLRVKDVPLGKLIDVLRQRHGLKIRVDDKAIAAAGLTTDRITAVDVQQATLEQLLEQAAAPLGLTAELQGDTVVIEPKK